MGRDGGTGSIAGQKSKQMVRSLDVKYQFSVSRFDTFKGESWDIYLSILYFELYSHIKAKIFSIFLLLLILETTIRLNEQTKRPRISIISVPIYHIV